MKIKRDNLYEIIRSICKKEYILGIHGTFNAKSICIEESLQRADNIIKVGLQNYYSDSRKRNIHRTVKFLGKMDDQRDQKKIVYQLNNYNWMDGTVYLLIAIPRILRNDQNENMYLGIPNNDLIIYHEDTSFMDKIMYGTIPSFFILGYYYQIDTDYVNLIINQEHIAFKNHTVENSYFKNIQAKLKNALKNSNCPLLQEKMNEKELLQLKEYLKKIGYTQNMIYQQIPTKFWNQLWISETIKQYLDEENKIPLPPSKFTQEQIMKILENSTRGVSKIKKKR